ncbi:MAG: HAD family hydrolase [Bacteroidales bacterium]|nr:HAD family hydrolase [Bacteroidales bacterium]
MKAVILDYGATIDSNGKHWAEVMWDAYCQASLPVTKDRFREAYIYAERYLSMEPDLVRSEYNFFELMQVRFGIQLDYLISEGELSQESLLTTLKLVSDGEVPIIDDMTDLTNHFVDFMSGVCYDYARRCTLEAMQIVEELSSDYQLALVSNFYGNLESVLQDFGLLRCFRHVIDSGVVGVRKPDPRIFQIAIERLNVPTKDIVVVGDSYNKDIEPAISLGCKAVWLKGVSWNPNADDINFEPSISSLHQLSKAIALID